MFNLLEFTDNSLLFTVLECYRIALVTQERAYKDRVEACQFRSEQQEQAKEFNKKTGRLSSITQVNKAKKAHPGALLITFFHKKLEPDADTPICAVKKTFEAEISAACKA